MGVHYSQAGMMLFVIVVCSEASFCGENGLRSASVEIHPCYSKRGITE